MAENESKLTLEQQRIVQSFIEGRSQMECLASQIDMKLNLVEVRSSRIYGRGVFAKVDIQEGALITWYPGDIIRYVPNLKQKRCGFIFSDRLPESIIKNITQGDNSDFMDEYHYIFSDNICITGYPGLVNDPSYLGHICNDGAKSSTPSDRSVYEKISSLRRNAFIEPQFGAHVGIFASRNITAGEEILLSYGYDFWESLHQ